MNARFINKQQLTSDIFCYSFDPDHSLNITAGQFVEISLKIDKTDDRGNKRWFTVSSSPEENIFSITTRIIKQPSSFKIALNELAVGDMISVSEPMGDFVLPIDKTTNLLMVAGGIGITPYLSIMSHLKMVGEKRNIDLIYAVNDINEAVDISIYEDYISSIQVLITSKEGNKLSAELIYQQYKKLNDLFIYLAGPEAMVETVGQQLLDMGVNSSCLIRDYFPGYDD
jgi:ferredoxin-NADP reductase